MSCLIRNGQAVESKLIALASMVGGVRVAGARIVTVVAGLLLAHVDRGLRTLIEESRSQVIHRDADRPATVVPKLRPVRVTSSSRITAVLTLIVARHGLHVEIAAGTGARVASAARAAQG